jgi:quinol monooxygenase YgiN
MNKEQVILNVRWKAAPGREAELESRLLALVGPSRAEPGCIQYDFHRNVEDPSVFMFCEAFISQAALDAHIATPHFQAFAAAKEKDDPSLSVDVTKWTKLE